MDSMGTSAVSFMSLRFLVMLLPLLLFSHSVAAQNQSGRRRVGDPPVERSFYKILERLRRNEIKLAVFFREIRWGLRQNGFAATRNSTGRVSKSLPRHTIR